MALLYAVAQLGYSGDQDLIGHHWDTQLGEWTRTNAPFLTVQYTSVGVTLAPLG